MARNIRINKRKEPPPPASAVIPKPSEEPPRANLTALPDAMQEAIRSVQELGRALRPPSPPPVIGVDYGTALETHRRMTEAQRRPDREVRVMMDRDLLTRSTRFMIEGPILGVSPARIYAEVLDEECMANTQQFLVDLVVERLVRGVIREVENEVRRCLIRGSTGELGSVSIARELDTFVRRAGG